MSGDAATVGRLIEVKVTPELLEDVSDFLLKRTVELQVGDVSTPELVQSEFARRHTAASRLAVSLVGMLLRHEKQALDLEVQAAGERLIEAGKR